MALVIIPARYGSTRFPGKPLALLMGKPVIEHVYRKAEGAREVEEVIVATDDDRIREAVEGFGGKCVMTSPAHCSGSDRLGEVVSGRTDRVIVNLQGDEPLMEPSVIDRVIRPHLGQDPPDIATAARELVSLADFRDGGIVKVVVNGSGDALYFSRSAIPAGWTPGSGTALGHIGIYAFSREALLRFVSIPRGELERLEDLEQLRALENGMRIAVVRVEHFEGVGIDRPEDIQRAEKIMRESGLTLCPDRHSHGIREEA